MHIPAIHTPSPDLLKAVRGNLVLRGSSLSAWAISNKVKRQNLTKAILGEWRGEKATQLVDQICEEVLSGVSN